MWVKFKQRRFQAMRVNQKWAFFSFNVSWRNRICVASVFTLSEKICPNISSKSPLKRAKFWFRLACATQKCCCLNSYLHRLHTSQRSVPSPPPPTKKKSNTKIPASKTYCNDHQQTRQSIGDKVVFSEKIQHNSEWLFRNIAYENRL